MTAPAIAPRARRAAVVERDSDADRIARATVIVEVRMNAPSFRRKLATGDVLASDDKTDPEMLHVRKDLIDPDALSAISGHRAKFVRYIDSRAVSCSMLRGGMRLVPLALVEEVDQRAITFIKERAALVADLVANYEVHKRSAKKRLGKRYDEREYPSASTLTEGFAVTYRFLSFNVPAALENLNRELAARERAKVEAEWAEAGDEIRQALRESFASLNEQLAERLTPDAEGKPRTFQNSTVAKLQDFLATFAARDLTGDTELAKLARKAKAVLDGVDPNDVRKNDDVRTRVLAASKSIQASLAKMEVNTKGARRFAADDEV